MCVEIEPHSINITSKNNHDNHLNKLFWVCDIELS